MFTIEKISQSLQGAQIRLSCALNVSETLEGTEVNNSEDG